MDDGLPPLREVVARHGLRARKSLGQNFLLDLNLTRRIARLAAPFTGVTIIEVGAGPGGLTRALLLEGAEKIIAIERDPRCLPALHEIARAWPGRLVVVEGDALEMDITALASTADGPLKIAANLPYNIGTALFTRWMSGAAWPPFWHSMTLMFQREVAARIIAQPGTAAYGRLSVLAQWRADAEIAFEVSPQAFTPPPKVTSAVVCLKPKPPLCEVPSAAVEKVTRAAFGQRRKMLRQSLKSLGVDPRALLEAAAIAETARAEDLSIADFCRLASALAGAR